jgi:hypothetical protein
VYLVNPQHFSTFFYGFPVTIGKRIARKTPVAASIAPCG